MLKRFGMELNPVSGEHGDPAASVLQFYTDCTQTLQRFGVLSLQRTTPA